jgi:hypothetical protein
LLKIFRLRFSLYSSFSILKSLRLFLVLSILLQASSLFAAQDSDYISELIQQSIEKKLSEKRYWHLLLHYRKTFFSGYQSEAGEEKFFLASHGKRDPQAELEATIRQFFSDELVGTSHQTAQCAFIARYHWIKSELGFDSKRLPEQECDRFKAWFSTLNPQSVTLIFPSAYMNNPASMFGHTLLRIDQIDQSERILDYTVSYAAKVTTDNSMLYVFFGLFGGFNGNFSTIPYYIQVQKYSNLENRDIWEYKLTLTNEQIERMLMHAWELGNTYFTYYFFSKNCSYELLPLLEVADPSLSLTDSFQYWTIPADTLRKIVAQPGLVKEIVYRPSRSTQVRQKRALLSETESALFSDITREAANIELDRLSSLPMERQALLLDIAYDYTRYQSVADDADSAAIKKKQRLLLERRSRLKVHPEEVTFVPTTSPPENGHETARIGVGLGWREGEPFEALTIRPAYHDLLDDETGYIPGAQIELLNTELRYYNHADRFELHRLSLANILSLFPFDPLFKKPSWRVNAGIERLSSGHCEQCRYFELNVGTGAALQTHLLKQEVLYLFLQVEADYGRFFNPDYRAGAGSTVGFLGDITNRWKAHFFTTYLSYPLGERSHEFKVSLQQRITLKKDLALRVDLNRRQILNQRAYEDEGLMTLHVYF